MKEIIQIEKLIDEKRDKKIELRQRIEQMRENPIITEHQTACEELESLIDDVLALSRTYKIMEDEDIVYCPEELKKVNKELMKPLSDTANKNINAQLRKAFEFKSVPIPIHKIKVGDFHKRLKTPLYAEVHPDDDKERYIFYETTLKLLATAETIDNGLALIQEQFKLLWDEYVETKEELAPDAERLKEKLLEMVE